MGMDAIFGIVKSCLLLMLGEAYSSFNVILAFLWVFPFGDKCSDCGSNTFQYGTYMHILASIATLVLGVMYYK